MVKRKRIGIFGWGIVAPRSPNIDAFESNLGDSGSWLKPFEAFGPSNFLTGTPDFEFETYKPWIDARFEPRKFAQLDSKMGQVVKYAIGGYIQALGQNPGIEKVLQDLGHQAHIYVGTGLGDLDITYKASLGYARAQRRWNRFWSAPERNADMQAYTQADSEERARLRAAWDAPADPSNMDPDALDYDDARDAWYSFWIGQSDQLSRYLEELRDIEALSVVGDIDNNKGHLIRRKMAARKKLNARYGCPPEPWTSVDPKILWNISNIGAAQISMLGKITGPAVGTIAACSGFGTSLKMADNAIQLGQAKAAVVGMSDNAPHPLVVAAFHGARVVSADGAISKPFTGMRGTHVSGGACVWIVGDYDYFTSLGMKPLGLEILSVAVTSDAEHIITPSDQGPRGAIKSALKQSGVKPGDISAWDMHATATPGDWTELQNVLSFFPGDVALTARKGTFGHGMSACGGWELTAQHLGLMRGKLHSIDVTAAELHDQIKQYQDAIVTQERRVDGAYAGKINMGVGGINACVICKRW